MNPGYYAELVLNKLKKVDLPINLEKIAEMDSILIEQVKADNFEGILLVEGESAIIGVNQAIRELGRKRFTIAHELGHFYLPTHYKANSSNFSCSVADLNTYNSKDGKEYEANEFAANLLMPENIIQEKVKRKDLNHTLLYNLAEEFGTSLTATCIRIGEIVKDYAVICSRDSKIWWFRKNNFPYFISRGKLSDESIASGYFNGHALPEQFSSVSVNAWLDDDRLSRSNKEIEELSVSLPYYNCVLTFLYAEQDEEDESLGEISGKLSFTR